MKRASKVILIPTYVLLSLLACRKVNNSRSTEPAPYYSPTGAPPGTFPAQTASLNQLFKELRSIPEKQYVTAGVLQTITFSKGTRLIFYPNSFKDASGNFITSGTVCIEMTEMYKPGDMIANRATTVTTAGELLISGGQVYINATKDGQKIDANKYGIAFRQPAASTQPMSLYYGSTNNKDTLATWTIANAPGPGASATGTVSDSFLAALYLFDSCTNFGFINCDAISDYTTPRTQVNIVMTNKSYNDKNTMVFVILPSINSTVAAGQYSSLTNTFDVGSDHPFHKVPVGLKAGIVAITIIDGQYYYFEKSGLTITDGMTVTATMAKQTADYVKTKLKAL